MKNFLMQMIFAITIYIVVGLFLPGYLTLVATVITIFLLYLFAPRRRWVIRVLNGAGIDSSSKTGVELSNTLVQFSKYCQEKNRLRHGALGPLNLPKADWSLFAAMMALQEPRAVERISRNLSISRSEAMGLLAKVRNSAEEIVVAEERPQLSTFFDLVAQSDEIDELGNAAEQGDADAQYELGWMYDKGNGVPQDYVAAHTFYNLAAANGREEAKTHRDKLAAKMTAEQIAEAQRRAQEWDAAHPR